LRGLERGESWEEEVEEEVEDMEAVVEEREREEWDVGGDVDGDGVVELK
jgi:hypothetical protein